MTTWREFQHRHATEDEVRGWYRRWPDAGVAIVTGAISGVLPLDVDPRNGGPAALAQLEAEKGPVPFTRRTLSGRGDGGGHHWFAHPGGHVPKRKIGKGLDLLGDGNLLVCPPSIHEVGGHYSWATDPREPLAPAPAWLVQRARAGRVDPVKFGGGRGRPAKLEQRVEFVQLFEAVGVALNGTGSYTCPWHDDQSASLSVAPDRAVFSCKATSCGKRGGLRALRQLVTGSPSKPRLTCGDVRVPLRSAGPPPDLSDKHGQPPRSEPEADPGPGCGAVLFQRHRDNPRHGRLVQVRCHQRSCQRCRPSWERDASTHYAAKFAADGREVHLRTIGAKAWEGVRKRVTALAGHYVRVPASRGRLTVFTTGVSGGEPVPDVGEALARVFASLPYERDGRGNVTASRGWGMSAVAEEGHWEVLLVSVSWTRARATAAIAGLTVLRHTEHVSSDAAVVDVLLPADPNDTAFLLFSRLAGLHERGERRRTEAAEAIGRARAHERASDAIERATDERRVVGL